MVKKKIHKAQGPGIISTHSQKHPALITKLTWSRQKKIKIAYVNT